MCMTNAGTTHDNFILQAPPVAGLPITQDRLDRMKLVRDRTIPVIVSSGSNILAATIQGTPTLPRGNSGADLAEESAFSLPLMPTKLVTQPKIMSSLAKFKKTHFRVIIPIK